MSLITQYSRISHHTLYGLTPGTTFSVPTSEDFTDGTWTIKDLALSEIGVNEADKKVYIRIDNEIKEFQLAGGTSSAEPLSTTLVAGNTTGPNWIEVDSGYGLQGTDGVATITDTISIDPEGLLNGTGIKSENTTTGISTSIGVYPDQTTIEGAATGVSSLTTFSGANIVSSATDTASTVTDTISIDPQGLANGTGITSIDATTGEISSVSYTPTNIYQQINDGTTSLSSIDHTLTSFNLSVSGGSLTTTNVVIVDTDNIKLTTAGVEKVIDGDRQTTSNNTPTTIYQVITTADTATSFRAIVKGIDNTYTNVYGAELFGVFGNSGGTITQVSTTDKTEKTSFSTATSDLDTDGTYIRVIVTGETATTILWEVSVEYI